jgi:hypothetical protein
MEWPNVIHGSRTEPGDHVEHTVTIACPAIHRFSVFQYSFIDTNVNQLLFNARQHYSPSSHM